MHVSYSVKLNALQGTPKLIGPIQNQEEVVSRGI